MHIITGIYFNVRLFDFVNTDRYLCAVRDPEYTKKKIIMSASILFNTKGYKSTSISDITTLAGITKGAIYKHFKDKAELEKRCLTSMTGVVLSNLTKRIKEADDARGKLFSILDYFKGYAVNSPFKGGCPLMNAAIEVDDTDVELKKVVAKIMLGIQDGIRRVIQNGKDRNQIKDNVDPVGYANLIYMSLEGGIMMMKVTDDTNHLLSVIEYLKADLETKLI